MDFIKVDGDEHYRSYIEGASSFFNTTLMQEWENYTAFPTLHPMPPMSGKLDIDDLSLQIKDQKLEFLNSSILCRPMIDISRASGNIKTLSATVNILVSDVRVIGNLRIDDSKNVDETQNFYLMFQRMQLDFLVGLSIIGDDFCIDNIEHKLTSGGVNFSYSLEEEDRDRIYFNENNKIHPLDQITDKNLRQSMELYMAEHVLKDIITETENLLRNLVHFEKVTVSDFVGLDYGYRDRLRMHKKKITLCFDQFFDEVIKLTNDHVLSSETTSISLPDFSGIFRIINFKTRKFQRFQATQGSIQNLATIKRRTGTTIHLEKNQVVLFVDINISGLTVEYKEFVEDTANCVEPKSLPIPVEHKAYLKIKIQRLENNQINLDFLEFKFLELRFNKHFNENNESCKYNDIEIDEKGEIVNNMEMNTNIDKESNEDSNKEKNVTSDSESDNKTVIDAKNVNIETEKEANHKTEKDARETEKKTDVEIGEEAGIEKEEKADQDDEIVDKKSEKESDYVIKMENEKIAVVEDTNKETNNKAENNTNVEFTKQADKETTVEIANEVGKEATKQSNKQTGSESSKMLWKNPQLVSWTNYVLGYLTKPLVEDIIGNAVRAVIKTEALIPLAVHPTNFEDLENSDRMEVEDTDDENEAM